jgi:cyclophilin family peptidyl-prolyl cis-trans isomerase
MKKIILVFILLLTMSNIQSQEKEAIVALQTEFGTLKIKLYKDTPLHKANFLKLVSEGFYTDLLFHRVIEHFMVQGGDPDSKNASDTTRLGTGDLGYTVPAEIVYPAHFHKRGALAAARTGNDANPEKASSASQFYIVTGKKYSEKNLSSIEKPKFERFVQDAYNKLQAESKATIKGFYSSGDLDGLAAFRQGLYKQAEEAATLQNLQFTPEQRLAYTQQGGAPHLDGEYTVFGEVIEGLDVLDKLEKVKVNKNDRPVNNVKMNIMQIED